MDIFIYFSPRLLSTPKDEIEDALEECMGDKGEVTGGGIGPMGVNIDVEVFNDEDGLIVLSDIKQVLIDLGAPQDTELVIDGERQNLFA